MESGTDNGTNVDDVPEGESTTTHEAATSSMTTTSETLCSRAW